MPPTSEHPFPASSANAAKVAGDPTPTGGILVFQPRASASLSSSLVALRVIGYAVETLGSVAELESFLAGLGTGDTFPYVAAIVDLAADPQQGAKAVEVLENAERFEGAVALIVDSNEPRPIPAVDRYPTLKHPVTTPRLTKVLRRMSGLSSVDVPSSSGGVADAAIAAPSGTSTQVSDYELIAEIASGGMGTVFVARRANEVGFQRLFAVKVMHPHLAKHGSFVSMFLDEASLASRLHHPNVVSVLDLGQSDMGYYVVMPYIEGCSLAQLQRRSRKDRPAKVLIPIIIDALEGLHAAHNLTDDEGNKVQLVHRDVSPENILVGTDGRAAITDFGVAKATTRLTRSAHGSRKGKLRYAAPELINAGEVDARTDIFGMGAVLWSALTGQNLFDGPSEAAIVRKILEEEIPAPSTVGAKPPACFDEICLKALARDPNERFASALDMAEALRKAAMDNGLFGSPAEIADWVNGLFADEFRERRESIRNTKGNPSTAALPPLLVEEPSDPGKLSTPGAGATEVDSAESGPIETETEEKRDKSPGLLIGGLVGVAAAAVAIFMLSTSSADDEAATKKHTAAPTEKSSAAASKPPIQPSAASPTPVAPPLEPADDSAGEPEETPSEPDEAIDNDAVEPDEATPPPEEAAPATPAPRRRPSRKEKKSTVKPTDEPSPPPEPTMPPGTTKPKKKKKRKKPADEMESNPYAR